jgi:hypothetical protein
MVELVVAVLTKDTMVPARRLGDPKASIGLADQRTDVSGL